MNGGADGFEVRMAVFRLARRLRAERAGDGLGDTHVSVLAALAYDGPQTSADLATRERVAAASMHHTVAALQEAGYVSRAPSTTDRRRFILEITASGEQILRETVRRRDAWIEAALSELSEAERSALLRAVPVMRSLASR